jgi:hypothetical protein
VQVQTILKTARMTINKNHRLSLNDISNNMIVFLGLSLTLAFGGCATKSKDKNEFLDSQSKQTIDKFFEAIASDNYKKGLIELFKSNQNISLEDSSTILLEKNFYQINETSGKFVSDSLLRQNQIGDDIGAYSYLAKYEKTFYRFLFIFYNNGHDTKIYKFSFDAEIPAELEESIKFYMK